MITYNAYAVVLSKESTGRIALYYNHIKKEWVKEFQLGCACFDKDEAQKVLNALDIFGATIVGGRIS